MANLASTDITYTPTAVRGRIANRVHGTRQKKILVKMAFGDGALTYPLNGVPLSTTASDYGLLRSIDRIEIFDKGQNQSIDWRMDHSNQKIMGYNPMRKSPIIHEEVVTLASTTGTLATPPAYIMSIVDSDSNPMTLQEADIAVGSVKAAHCSVNFTTGVMNTLTGEALTKLTVTYIPQFSQGFFSLGNMVIAEAINGVEAGANLANRAALIQLVTEPTNAIALVPITDTDAEASGECTVEINNAGATTVKVHADEVGTGTIQVTYLKYSGIPTTARTRAFIDEATRTLVVYETSSEVFRWTEDAAHSREYPVIPGFGVQFFGVEATNDPVGLWVGPLFVAADNEPRLNLGKNEWETADSTAMTSTTISALELTPDLMGGAIELFPNIDAPEAQTLWAMVYGW